MNKGDRVTTPLGTGTVAWLRLAPPLFVAPAAVSVVLDSQRDRRGYTGTMFPSEKVEVVP